MVWGDQGDEENSEKTRERRQLIGHAIYTLRKLSKSFDKLFTRLHNSDSEFTVSFGDLRGSEGQFRRARETVFDLDENGEPVGYDEFGSALENPNPNTGGDIRFDLAEIDREGLNVEDVAPEEFGHAYQHLFYTNGKFENYLKTPPSGNYEFEGQMISGIIKNQSGIRLHPNYGATRFAEQYGIKFNLRKFGIKLDEWYDRSDNFYRTFYNAPIDKSRMPSALLKLKNKKR
ncbi:MAG: hypothetical protein AB3N14_16665 [Flavobacteriaceae bacterium]